MVIARNSAVQVSNRAIRLRDTLQLKRHDMNLPWGQEKQFSENVPGIRYEMSLKRYSSNLRYGYDRQFYDAVMIRLFSIKNTVQQKKHDMSSTRHHDKQCRDNLPGIRLEMSLKRYRLILGCGHCRIFCNTSSRKVLYLCWSLFSVIENVCNANVHEVIGFIALREYTFVEISVSLFLFLGIIDC